MTDDPKPIRPAIQVADCWMTFRGKRPDQPIQVLERVDFEARRGEFVVIVGPSGCGKSTLLNIVAGFLNPSRGRILVEGQPVRGPDPRRIFVFQENGIFPWLTVTQNIGFGLSRRPKREREATIRHYIEMVGLTGFEQAYPRELSGGMRQRVEIARALASRPDIIYMDEPFGALDFITRLKMRADLVRIWQEEKKTILFVTHDIEEAVQLADRVLVMNRRPATIQEVVPVDLPRPRDLDSPGYLRTRDRIFAAMGMSPHTGVSEAAGPVPDSRVTAAAPAPTAARPLPLPECAETDVVVIGGGPAGSILGSYLARANIKHLILDKAVHPRPHVGESLVCSTTRVFQELDLLPKIECQGFVRKYGALWTHYADHRQYRIRFREMPHLGIKQQWTYHVDRSQFDQLLLEHARSSGSAVIEGAHVERVELRDDGFADGVTVRVGNQTRRIRARIVVDASGRGTVIGSQLKLKKNDPDFHQFALHNWFEGVDRGDGESADYVHIHILAQPRSWLWQIPITPTITSVGIVTDREHFPKDDESAAAVFQTMAQDHPLLARKMCNARAIYPYTREGNYSYVMDRFVGDGWLMVGDAARFIDPIFSSGISVAAESARRAAETIGVALANDDVSAAALAHYDQAIRRSVDIWREFILLYYRMPVLFLDLLQRAESRFELLELLQGEVFDRHDVPILDRMRTEIAAVEADPDHRWCSNLS